MSEDLNDILSDGWDEAERLRRLNEQMRAKLQGYETYVDHLKRSLTATETLARRLTWIIVFMVLTQVVVLALRWAGR